jgi:hypothetical protein
MGTLPLFINYLVKATQIPYFTGYVLIISTLIGYLGILFIKQIKSADNKEFG